MKKKNRDRRLPHNGLCALRQATRNARWGWAYVNTSTRNTEGLEMPDMREKAEVCQRRIEAQGYRWDRARMLWRAPAYRMAVEGKVQDESRNLRPSIHRK